MSEYSELVEKWALKNGFKRMTLESIILSHEKKSKVEASKP